MTDRERCRRRQAADICRAVLDDIAPRLERGLGPIDLPALEAKIVEALRAAVEEEADLFTMTPSPRDRLMVDI